MQGWGQSTNLWNSWILKWYFLGPSPLFPLGKRLRWRQLLEEEWRQWDGVPESTKAEGGGTDHEWWRGRRFLSLHKDQLSVWNYGSSIYFQQCLDPSTISATRIWIMQFKMFAIENSSNCDRVALFLLGEFWGLQGQPRARRWKDK